MIHRVLNAWEEHPLPMIMGLAILFRLLASIYAKGFGMVDDHFIVIEPAQTWLDGEPSEWLPGGPGNTGPSGFNLFYPGIHYTLFILFKWIGLTNPQGKMLVVRLLHGAWSLITVWYGYKIAEKLDHKHSARLVGLLLAIFWFMPWMSVRNLVEMTCVPCIVLGYWMILRNNTSGNKTWNCILAGLFFALAFNIRPQSAFFPFGIGLILLFQGKWKELFTLTLSTLLVIVIIQGSIDTAIWGVPFVELIGYIKMCIAQRNDYISLPWYNYILTLSGMLIPPVSFFLIVGFAKTWKRLLIIFLPVMLFLVFHSYYPNKQERFIVPMIPLFIIAGTIGWHDIFTNSRFWRQRKKLHHISWFVFWIVNTILLLILTLTYSKRARVEAMSYLSDYPDIRYILVIDQENSPELIPKFYLNQWPTNISDGSRCQDADTLLNLSIKNNRQMTPAFILFTGGSDIKALVAKARWYHPRIVYETTIHPGFIYRLLFRMNPKGNKNTTIYIYRNTEIIAQKKK